jgi:hypothetical protein
MRSRRNAILAGMAAKNKKISRAVTPLSHEDRDLNDLLGLHFQASRRVEEVLEEAREMRSAGRIADARRLMMHAAGIQQGLRALEAEVRLSARTARAIRAS